MRFVSRRDLLISVSVALPLVLVSTIVDPPPPILVWNASASAPLGLYRVDRLVAPEVGDYAVARLTPRFAALASARGYLPSGVPLVKRVAAVRFDRVCADSADISINGRWAAARWRRDPKGLRLPWWEGCELLRDGELFLLAEDRPDAFDGRYMGITAPSELVGKAILLWPR